jgi:hypothetical protein
MNQSFFLMFSKLRRKSKKTIFTFSHHSALAEIEPIWDAFLPKNHHLLSENLWFLENNTNIEGHFISVSHDQQRVGCIYLQKVPVPFNNVGFSFKNLLKIDCLVSSISSVKCSLNFLVCGNIYRPNQEGYFFKEGISKDKVFDEFLEFIEGLEKTIGFAGILIKECATPMAVQGKFMPIKQDVSMVMGILPSWQSIEDYAQALDKKYRKRFLKIRSSADSLHKRELSEVELSSYKTRMFQLYNEVYASQDFRLTTISASYFLNLKRLLGEKIKIFGFFQEDSLLAFTTHIYNDNSQMEIHYVGFSYEFNKRYNLYFNILQFGLEAAIEGQQKSLELGRTAHVAKASLGAKPVENYNYVYFKKHIYSWSFQLFLKNMYANDHTQFEKRSPFTHHDGVTMDKEL